jgi:hypothetical protein
MISALVITLLRARPEPTIAERLIGMTFAHGE